MAYTIGQRLSNEHKTGKTDRIVNSTIERDSNRWNKKEQREFSSDIREGLRLNVRKV